MEDKISAYQAESEERLREEMEAEELGRIVGGPIKIGEVEVIKRVHKEVPKFEIAACGEFGYGVAVLSLQELDALLETIQDFIKEK